MIDGPLDGIDLVIDASIGVKWFLPESDSESAMLLLSAGVRCHVPSLFFTEVAQTIWKKVRLRNEISEQAGRQLVLNMLAMPLVIYPSDPYVESAFDVAVATGRTVYDSVYLVLAESIGCRMVTADERFYNALRGVRQQQSVIAVKDLSRFLSGEGAG